MDFNRYLSKFGPHEFQPFSAREVFEKQVKGSENFSIDAGSSQWILGRPGKNNPNDPEHRSNFRGEKRIWMLGLDGWWKLES